MTGNNEVINVFSKGDVDIQFRDNMTVELIQHMGSDEMMVNAARVSTGLDQDKPSEEKLKGLIGYLIRERHGSPSEHLVMTFRIEAPIFVIREFQRHRIASYSEASGRYSVMDGVFYHPNGDRKLVQVGKTGHYQFEEGTDGQFDEVSKSIVNASVTGYKEYQHLLEQGIAKEVARMTLPLNMYSSMYVTMNSRSLMNFLSLRTHEPDSSYPSFPQIEIEMVARQMEDIFKELYPVTYEAWNNNGRVAP